MCVFVCIFVFNDTVHPVPTVSVSIHPGWAGRAACSTIL